MSNIAILIWFGVSLGLASWYVIHKTNQREKRRLAEAEARKERTEQAVARVRAFRPPDPPALPDFAQAEEMLQQVNRQMDEAMRGMDQRLSAAMQQANSSMERAMENMTQTMARQRRIARHHGNLEITGDLTVRGGNITITTTEGPGGIGDVVIRAGNARGVQQEIRLGRPEAQRDPAVPPEPKPEEKKLPPTIYERLNQDDD